MGGYRDLRVWQQAMDLAEVIYRETEKFPKHELYGLVSQLRRAAVSVPSNVAEGKGRQTDRDYANFLFHARGSLLEVETQVTLARRLKYLTEQQEVELLQASKSVGQLLTGLINSLTGEHTSAASAR
jgi:four helix bundle protein